jgi:PPOX class probable F420-dependent enzyme
MDAMNEETREAFLAEARLGVLSMLTESGAPVAVPVWFEWGGGQARMFTSAASPKMRRLERDPRVSLLVARPSGEKEEWVAIDGRVEIHNDGALELAERLAERYWDLSEEGHKATLDLWRKAAQALRHLQLVPERIRSYVG